MVLISILKRKRMKIILKDHFLEFFFYFEEIMAPFSQLSLNGKYYRLVAPKITKEGKTTVFSIILQYAKGARTAMGVLV